MKARLTRAVAALALVAAGALAVAPPAPAQSDWDRENIPERLDEALRGLLDRMKPAMEDMIDMLGVLEQIDSPTHYEKPEILPNGDILIRRSPDAPDWPPEGEGDDDEPRWRRAPGGTDEGTRT